MKYLPLLLGIVLFIGCKHGNKGVSTDTDPILTQDPDLKVLTEQLHKEPTAALYYERGGMLRRKRFDSLALKDYQSAVKMDTTKAEYYSAIGDLMFEHKDLTGALPWIEKAVAKNPTDKKAHLKIAKLFLYLNQAPRALAEINIVLRGNVYDPEAYFLKGMIYKNNKDTSRAISSFQTAIQVAPDYRDAVIQLGLLFCDKNDTLGLRYLENAFAIDSTDVLPLYARGMYYQEHGKPELAKEEYKRCVMHDRHYSKAFFNTAYILYQQDSLDKAWRQYDIVTKIDPENAAAYFNRGLCSESMHKISEAIADYKQAAYLDSTYVNPKNALKRLAGQVKK